MGGALPAWELLSYVEGRNEAIGLNRTVSLSEDMFVPGAVRVTKAHVDQEIMVEENEVLQQGRVAILADWWRYYPNQFPEDGLPLVNPPNPYRSRFSANVACLAGISVTSHEAHSANEDSA